MIVGRNLRDVDVRHDDLRFTSQGRGADRGTQCLLHVSGVVHVVGVSAHGLREQRNVGLAQGVIVFPDATFVREKLAHALTDHAQVVVVEYDPYGTDTVRRSGGDFGAVHQEGAVTADRETHGIGCRQFGADHRTNGKAHRPHRQRAVNRRRRTERQVVKRPADTVARIDKDLGIRRQAIADAFHQRLRLDRILIRIAARRVDVGRLLAFDSRDKVAPRADRRIGFGSGS